MRELGMKGIGITAVAFVGYPVSDFGKAREFYGGVLGLEQGAVFEDDGVIHWMEFEAGNMTIGLGRAADHWVPGPQGGGACFEVEDIEVAIERLNAGGGKVVSEIQDFPICRLAIAEDPDGNGFALHQKKPHHPDLQG